MTCRICGRGACTESFHSIEAQEEFEQEQELRCDNCRKQSENLTPYFELLLCDACYAEAKNNDRINARSEE